MGLSPVSEIDMADADDETLQVVIGEHVVQCRNVDDKMRLEPVGGILADGSTEGYRPEEVEQMAATLERYGETDAAQRLRGMKRT
jgi:hypothetical protein